MKSRRRGNSGLFSGLEESFSDLNSMDEDEQTDDSQASSQDMERLSNEDEEEEDEVDLEEEEDEEEEDDEEEEEEDFQGGEGLSFDVHEADEFQTPQQEEMEWVQIRDGMEENMDEGNLGMEDEMVGRLRRRTRNDGNNMDASTSHNGEEDLDTSDFYLG